MGGPLFSANLLSARPSYLSGKELSGLHPGGKILPANILLVDKEIFAPQEPMLTCTGLHTVVNIFYRAAHSCKHFVHKSQC